MLKSYKDAELETEVRYELMFDDGCCNGFGFTCDEHGNTHGLTDDAKRNLAWCRENTDKFVRPGVVVKFVRQFRNPPSGICECGEEVFLVDEYMGACECPKCKRWYNLFGQELLPPRQWDEWSETWM